MLHGYLTLKHSFNAIFRFVDDKFTVYIAKAKMEYGF